MRHEDTKGQTPGLNPGPVSSDIEGMASSSSDTEAQSVVRNFLASLAPPRVDELIASDGTQGSRTGDPIEALVGRLDPEDLLAFATPHELKGFCAALGLTTEGIDPERLRLRIRTALYLPSPIGTIAAEEEHPEIVRNRAEAEWAHAESQRTIERQWLREARHSALFVGIIFTVLAAPVFSGLMLLVAAAAGGALGHLLHQRRLGRFQTCLALTGGYLGVFAIALLAGAFSLGSFGLSGAIGALIVLLSSLLILACTGAALGTMEELRVD